MNQEIADIKPPMDLPFDWSLLGWLLGIAAIIIATVFIGWFLKKRSAKSMKPVIVQLPWEKALQALQELEIKQLPKQGLFKEYFDGVSDIIRFYLEDRFDIRAPEMTTEEFLTHLQTTTVLTDAQQEILCRMMALADLVKFAKHVPTLNESESFYKTAVQLVEESRGI